jgi:hypothetical protein
MTQKTVIPRQLPETFRGNEGQKLDRIPLSVFLPQDGIDPTKQFNRIIMPAPPQIHGKFFQKRQLIGN